MKREISDEVYNIVNNIDNLNEYKIPASIAGEFFKENNKKYEEQPCMIGVRGTYDYEAEFDEKGITIFDDYGFLLHISTETGNVLKNDIAIERLLWCGVKDQTFLDKLYLSIHDFPFETHSKLEKLRHEDINKKIVKFLSQPANPNYDTISLGTIYEVVKEKEDALYDLKFGSTIENFNKKYGTMVDGQEYKFDYFGFNDEKLEFCYVNANDPINDRGTINFYRTDTDFIEYTIKGDNKFIDSRLFEDFYTDLINIYNTYFFDYKLNREAHHSLPVLGTNTIYSVVTTDEVGVWREPDYGNPSYQLDHYNYNKQDDCNEPAKKVLDECHLSSESLFNNLYVNIEECPECMRNKLILVRELQDKYPTKSIKEILEMYSKLYPDNTHLNRELTLNCYGEHQYTKVKTRAVKRFY